MTKVLVIDDEAPIRLLCRVNLEAEGMDVIEAADGPSGVELCEPGDAGDLARAIDAAAALAVRRVQIEADMLGKYVQRLLKESSWFSER